MVALVALGGAAGTMARAGVAAAMHAPWATLTVNLVGAFVLGVSNIHTVFVGAIVGTLTATAMVLAYRRRVTA